MRGKEDTFSLDVHGFQYVYWPARHTAFVHDTAIAREYYPSAVALVKELTGAPYAFVFEHSKSYQCSSPIGSAPAIAQYPLCRMLLLTRLPRPGFAQESAIARHTTRPR